MTSHLAFGCIRAVRVSGWNPPERKELLWDAQDCDVFLLCPCTKESGPFLSLVDLGDGSFAILWPHAFSLFSLFLPFRRLALCNLTYAKRTGQSHQVPFAFIWADQIDNGPIVGPLHSCQLFGCKMSAKGKTPNFLWETFGKYSVINMGFEQKLDFICFIVWACPDIV